MRDKLWLTIRPFGYERVYLPLCEVTNTRFHIQGGELIQRWARH